FLFCHHDKQTFPGYIVGKDEYVVRYIPAPYTVLYILIFLYRPYYQAFYLQHTQFYLHKSKCLPAPIFLKTHLNMYYFEKQLSVEFLHLQLLHVFLILYFSKIILAPSYLFARIHKIITIFFMTALSTLILPQTYN